MSSWETVESLPPSNYGAPHEKIILGAGEIRRRLVKGGSTAGNYNTAFKKQGRNDYHAASRTVDGVRYLYIWRDPLPQKETD